nr:MAG TPA: hypothetical protein [Caudoviricetes sp.]
MSRALFLIFSIIIWSVIGYFSKNMYYFGALNGISLT